MEMGETLAALRKEKKLGQKELAALLNLSVSTISNYEKGVHAPDFDTLCKMADFYGVTTDYLLGRTASRQSPGFLQEDMTEGCTFLDFVQSVQGLDREKRQNIVLYSRFMKYLQDLEGDGVSG